MGREITFDGITNCRDLGGLVNAEGKTLRRGCLLRAAHLHGAGDGDLRRLERDYRLQLVVDLRTPYEREQRPDRPVPGADRLEMPIFDAVTAGITREDGTPAPLVMPDMAGLYRIMVTEASCRAALGTVLRRIMGSDFDRGAVLWHCTAGKDRCGVVSALLLAALHVPEETIMADYLLTNAFAEQEAAQMAHTLQERGVPEIEIAAVHEVFCARERFLNAALDAIRECCETPARFLREGLGLPEELIATFREKMLC